MGESAIEVEGLRKSYGVVEAVRGLSFDVKRGEVFGLLGPNGAGKTTTVEILEGYRERSGGEVRVLGHDPQVRTRELQQRVGIVLQSCGFYPRLTVLEAVEHMAKAYPEPRDARATIALVGLEEKADARSNKLSGGQRRRLDLALALVGDPELVFLDEPTTGFDPAARRAAWGVIDTLKELGKTVLLTTHYLDEAQALADRVAIVKDGAIVAEGPPSDLGPSSGGYRISYRTNGRRVEHRTDDPTDLLHRLTGDALARGERLEGLEVARPTLEDVYLQLTEEPPATDAAGEEGGRVTPMALAWEQFRLERKLFWRNPSAAFFSFVLPLALLLLVASVFGSDQEELETLIPGIAGMSVMATTFNSMAYNLTFLREQGILKRVRGTPVPLPSYFAGFLGNAVANAFVQVLLVVVLGNVLYDVSWPHDWAELIAFTAVGVIAFGSLGIAFSHVIPNFDSTAAYVNAVFLPAIFISGVFYSSDSLPTALDALAQILPLKHVIDGFSGAIVTGQGLVDNAGALGAVAAWGAIGLMLAVRNFRWE